LALGIVVGGVMPAGRDAYAWCASLSGREGGGGSVSRRCQGACVLVAAGREGGDRGSGGRAVAFSGRRRSNARKAALWGGRGAAGMLRCWRGGGEASAGHRWRGGMTEASCVPLCFWGGGGVAGA